MQREHLLYGFVFGLLFPALFVSMVELINVFILILIFGWPILGGYLSSSRYPESVNSTLGMAMLGVVVGSIAMGAYIVQTSSDGFGGIAGVIAAALGIVYSLIFFVIGLVTAKIIPRSDE